MNLAPVSASNGCNNEYVVANSPRWGVSGQSNFKITFLGHILSRLCHASVTPGHYAARVLAGYFNKVTIIDRDTPPHPAEFRPGVPQTRHAHRLLPRGQCILEQQFPGLVDELLAHEAVAVDASKDISFEYESGRPDHLSAMGRGQQRLPGTAA